MSKIVYSPDKPRALTKDKKPSVLEQLKNFKEIVAAIPKKVREKKQERDL